MKILQINATYAEGSTGTLVQDLHYALQDANHESYVFWATGIRNGCKDENVYRIGTTFDHKIHALLKRLDLGQGFHSAYYTQQVCKKIAEIQPDIVHLHNLHSNYIHLEILLDFLADKGIPVLVTLHDCWFFTGHCTHYLANNVCMQWEYGCNDCPSVKDCAKKKVEQYWTRKKEAFKKLKFFAFNGVSQWTTAAAAKSLLSGARIYETIYNWIDTNVFTPCEDVETIRNEYGILFHEKLILGVSQGWGLSKGIADFQALAKALKGEAKILLVGEQNGYKSEENLCFVGRKNKEELIRLYSAADVFVNPSRMETFGLVTIEAMACGTPVVAYNNTGSAELVTQGCGCLVDDGDARALIETVKTVLKSEHNAYRSECCNWAKENFQKEQQVAKYIKLYKKIIALQKTE